MEHYKPKHLSRPPLYHATGGEQTRRILESYLQAPNESWLVVEPVFAAAISSGGPLDAPDVLVAGHVSRGLGGEPSPSVYRR